MMTSRDKLPRGLRNNNPGNIRRSGNNWKGKLPAGGDPSFEVFVDMAHGYRALMVNLRTYMTRHGLTTLEGLLTRWAPPVENDTRAYINAVVKLTGFTPNEQLRPDKRTLTSLAAAISRVENGVDACLEDIEEAWSIM